jgi:hypothetical protein
MANTKSLMIVLGLDTSGYTKGLAAARRQLKEFSQEMVIIGGAITAALGLSVKAALEDSVAVAGLSNSLKNVGVSYDTVRNSLDKLVQAQTSSTNYTDNEQMKAMEQLVLITGSYDKAVSLLPTVLDLAAAKQIDLTTSATYLGRIMNGNTAGLTRMMPWLIGVTDANEALSITMDKVKGAAVAVANPFTVLKNTTEQLSATIGEILLPALKEIIKTITPVINGIRDWMKENPQAAKTIIDMTAAIGLLFLALGTLGLIIPKIALGAKALGLAFGASTGPIGLILTGISLLIAGGIALYENWDMVSHYLLNYWDHLIIGFAELVKVMEFYNKSAVDWAQGVENQANARINARDTEHAVAASINDTTGAINNNTLALSASSDATQKCLDKVNALNMAYADQQSIAGQLGLTVDDVIQYMQANGYSIDAVAAAMQGLGDNAKYTTEWLKLTGISALDVYNSFTTMKKGIDEASAALAKYYQQIANNKDNQNLDVPQVWYSSEGVGYGVSAQGGATGNVTVPAFASGALIRTPQLMTSMATGQPSGVIGESGVERLSPESEGMAEFNLYLDGDYLGRAMGKRVNSRKQMGGS